MTTINSHTRQPTKLDYAEPTKFRFSLIKLPKVEYFCTFANIPILQIMKSTDTSKRYTYTLMIS